jgi:mannose-1-phosphate guanylyltransferase
MMGETHQGLNRLEYLEKTDLDELPTWIRMNHCNLRIDFEKGLIVLCCGFRAENVQKVLGDGSDYGVNITYVQEPTPRGTAGALHFAAEYLQDEFLMLNGDVLCDADLASIMAAHERSGAVGTLGLIEVEDPSAYGLVQQNENSSVSGFLEKPSADDLGDVLDYWISAGIYVLNRSVLDLIPGERAVSIETEVWPQLLGNGLFAHRFDDDPYWMDIGTPERYLQATGDILEGVVQTRFENRWDDAGNCLLGSVHESAVLEGVVLMEEGSVVGAGAHITGPTVIASDVIVADGAKIVRSVILHGASIGKDAHVSNAIVAAGAHIGEACELRERAMVGADAVIGDGNVLAAGIKVYPRVTLAAGAIRF